MELPELRYARNNNVKRDCHEMPALQKIHGSNGGLDDTWQQEKDVLELFFNLLCQLGIFHDYQINDKNENRCSFCNKEQNYDDVGGFIP